MSVRMPEIKKVVFNPPATVVLWTDGTKTVVKVGEDQEFSEEVGLAEAIAKKYAGTRSRLKKMVRVRSGFEGDGNSIAKWSVENYNLAKAEELAEHYHQICVDSNYRVSEEYNSKNYDFPLTLPLVPATVMREITKNTVKCHCGTSL